jgi:hypothetical protein
MTELDHALESFRQDKPGADHQSIFYHLFLNTMFYVPTVKESIEVEKSEPEEEVTLPMVVEVDGLNYLMLFDTEQRLTAWADKEVPFLTVPGHMIAELSAPDLYWALNVGTDFAKQFVPDEIAWIKDVVGRCKTEIVRQAGQNME